MPKIIGDVKVGNKVVIEDSAIIYGPVKIGDNCYIGNNVVIGYPGFSNKNEMIKTGKLRDGGKETVIGNNVVIYSNATIYEDVKIGKNVKVFHNALIREGVKIGDNCYIGTNSVLDGYLTIGNETLIHSGAYICAHSKIGNKVGIYPGVHLVNENETYSRAGIEHDIAASKYVGPIIKDYSVVGMNSTLLGGITLEEESFIGAGAVVTKSTESKAIYVGNPAKKIREWRNPRKLKGL